MTKFYEKPNLVSVIILILVFMVAIAYVLVTLDRRPEMESFTVDSDYTFPFNFDRIRRVVDLPNDLREISGLCIGNRPDELFSIQDEDGEIFIINTRSGNITDRFQFDKDRDYEGITRKGDTIYVLERDGDIHHFVFAGAQQEYEADKLETELGYTNDTEGIAYDSLTNSLLIVPKERELNPADAENRRRGVYSFDLNRRKLDTRPAYYIDEMEVGRIVFDKGRRYIIKPSGIAVDPLTGEIYVISSVGGILVVIDRESEIKHVELLEKNTFRQPEGITFDATGNLYISSEGRSGRAIVATIERGAKPVRNE